MRIDARRFGYAAAIVAGIVYFVSGFFAAIGSGATQGFFAYVLHLNLLDLVRPITVVSFAVGFVLFVALIGACAWMVARVYNALVLPHAAEEGFPATATQ